MPKCTLEIRDEVNVRFVGVDPSTRRKLKSKVEFFLPQARHMPAYKLGRWNGCVSFCDVGGRTFFHLLEDLLPIVVEAGYEIDVQDHRPQFHADFSDIQADYLSDQTWPSKHPAAGEPIVLRDYQVEVINRFLENPQSIQEVATGAGKTIITSSLSKLCEHLGRTIVIVPNKDLVVQTERDYKNIGLDVGVFYGDRKDYGCTHTICTWQSIESLRKKSKAGEVPIDIEAFLSGVVCVMVDEVHKAKADVLKEQLSSVFAHVPIRWGLTGTIPDAEHEALSCRAVLGPVMGELSSKELRDMGVLADLDIDVIQLQDPPYEHNSYAQELKWLVTNTDRVQHMSDVINAYASGGNTLVLIDRIATGELLYELNPDWVFVSGSTKSVTRMEHYETISDSDNKVIVATYGVAAVGINIPRIFNLVMVEPGKSFVRVIQTIGRGVRKAHDKDYVKVVDITSNLKYSKRHLTKRKKFYQDQQMPFTITKLKYLE